MPAAPLPGQVKGLQGRVSCSLCRVAHGVYQLATLLTELDSEDEASRLLVADALYRLGRLDDAHKALLVALSRRPQAAPVLVRLALLQLRRGFLYDANQVRGPSGLQQSGCTRGPALWQAPGLQRLRTHHPQPRLGNRPSLFQPHSATSSRCLASLTLSLRISALVFQVLMRISCSRRPKAQPVSSQQWVLAALVLFRKRARS